MTLRVLQSPDPNRACVRTYPDHDRFDFYETQLGPMELAGLIADLSNELARIHQYQRQKRVDESR